MNIVIVHDSKIPVVKYGGTERIIWDLGLELVKMGHRVTYLAATGSRCSFAKVVYYNPKKAINDQLPLDTEFVHIHFNTREKISFPNLKTIHGNLGSTTEFQKNTNFVSRNHARRFGADAYVYNGLNWDDYGKPNFKKYDYVHFLGKAAWRVKNVRGAIRIAAKNRTEIKILGGDRINFRMGLRITASKWAKFYGLVGGAEKLNLIDNSKALIFPVLWHEPFGLAIIESLYFGCPVLGTLFGSLPELVNNEVGFLSNSENELIYSFNEIDSFKPQVCHEYAHDLFNSKIMTQNYLKLYEKILNGGTINNNTPKYKIEENKLPLFQ